MESRDNIEQYEFFTPGEVCFFFEHDQKYADHIDDLMRRNRSLWRLFDDAGFRCYDVTSYDSADGEQATYSLVRAQLPAPPAPDDGQLRSLNSQVIDLLDETLNGIQEQRFGDSALRLTGVTPNWYSGAAQRLIDGGPGAEPVDANLKPDNLQPMRAAAVAKAVSRLGSAYEQQTQTCDVDVYVLDSIPLADSWKTALAPEHQSDYLRDLLRKLSIQTASDLGVVLPDSHHEIAGHLYEMSDHGLFIAGLIHDAAPEANIYLLEVLNKFGVGTMTSLLAGLNAIPTRTERPTIINCSLMMSARSSMLIQKFPNWKRLRDAEMNPRARQFGDKEQRLPQNRYLAALMQPLEKLIRRRVEILNRNRCVRIVAAAGNDGRQGEARPAARYPAAFPDVIGVSALDNRGKPAVYSNFADNPLSDGVATFGGATDEVNSTQADEINGIAGVYLAAFPDGSPSSGTARWAGTSFAAGVISGLLAKLVASGCDCDAAEHLLRSESPYDRPDVVTASQ